MTRKRGRGRPAPVGCASMQGEAGASRGRSRTEAGRGQKRSGGSEKRTLPDGGTSTCGEGRKLFASETDSEYDPRRKTSERSPRIDRILQIIPSGVEVLDIGCVQHDPERSERPDWLHQYLYDDRRDVLGIDIDRTGVEALQEEGYNVQYGNAETFELDREFDVIIAGEIIEHLENPGLMLLRCREHIKPKGKIIVTTPNPWTFLRLLRVIKDDIDINPEHTCWFCPSTLRELFSRTGWAVERIEMAGPVSRGVSNFLYHHGFEHIGGVAYVVTARPVHGENGAGISQKGGFREVRQ